MDNYTYISNADPKAIESLYQQYLSDPNSVDEGWKKFFEGFDFAQEQFPVLPNGKATTPIAGGLSAKEVQVQKLIHAYRSRAHLRSNTNPVRPRKDRKPILELEDFGLTKADLETEFQAGTEIGIGKAKP